jgi:hypothetical protein
VSPVKYEQGYYILEHTVLRAWSCLSVSSQLLTCVTTSSVQFGLFIAAI